MNLPTFLDLSAALTGFSLFDLRATGVAEQYLDRVIAELGQPGQAQLPALEREWAAIAGASDTDRQAGIDRMFASATLGEAVRAVTLLWYTGAWYRDNRYNYSTVSGETYVKGLMWKAIQAHPMAAEPQGFGAWSLPPPRFGADT
ncbi:MAG TPA: hypothetical protein VF409_09825 [Sphingomonas sp.]